MTLRVAVYGAAGRMGRAVVNVLVQDPGLELVSAIERQGCPALGQDAGMCAGIGQTLGIAITDELENGLRHAQVAVDFSLPDATRVLLFACAAHAVPAVVGTTGMDAATQAAVEKLAEVAPVVVAPNFSVGVNALWHLACRAAELVGRDFDIEIVEMHHRNKVDAPSGTANLLAEAVAQARGLDLGKTAVHGRSGNVGVRPQDQIAVLPMRGGDVVGEHTLILAGPGERLELTHRAHTREIFARGALRAAHWVVGQQPGRYHMREVLGLPA